MGPSRRHPLRFALALFAAACGSRDPNPPPDGGTGEPPALADRYLPLPVGGVLRYRVTDPDTQRVEVKRTTVEAEEDLGGAHAGTFAVRVRTETADGVTVSWQGYDGQQAVRYREEELTSAGVKTVTRTFEPARLRFDQSPERLRLGATWTETYAERTVATATGMEQTSAKSATWTVEATDEPVTVPAGTYPCVRVRRRSGTSSSDKVYWFAQGVGKVKEAGGQLEELQELSLPGVSR